MDNSFPGKDISSDDLVNKIPLVSNFTNNVEIAGINFSDDTFPIIAGPNMVESEKLIVEIATNVKKSGAHFLRGGAFKPLTFPYRSIKYNESGLQGLKWLQTAKLEADIPVITEIMEERYLDPVCEVADILQIGSRNMQNYPLIKEAARTMKPLMIKRHYGSSLRDWFGAVEYALNEGNQNILMCERGIVAPHTHKATSRFILDLQVIPATKELTSIPIGADPSHATFWNKWVESLSLASLAAGAKFLMVEVHPNPKEAAVDPLQPLTFTEFSLLVKKINALRATLKNL